MTARRAAPDPIAGVARIVGWGLALWGAVQVAAFVFAHNATGAVGVEAAIALWGAGQVAVTWSDPLARSPSWGEVGRRAGVGAGLGAACAASAVVAALVAHVAVLGASAPDASPLLVGLLVAGAGAVRDEILLRGVVLRASQAVLPVPIGIAACGLAAAAARFGTDGALGLGVLAQGLSGATLGALWVRDRGAWMAWAANTAWTWTMGTAAAGALVDVRFAAEPEVAPSTLAILVVASAVSCVWATRATAQSRNADPRSSKSP